MTQTMDRTMSNSAVTAVQRVREQAETLAGTRQPFASIVAEVSRTAARLTFLERRENAAQSRVWWINRAGRRRNGRTWPVEIMLATCEGCGKTFVGKRHAARVCQPSCRMGKMRAAAKTRPELPAAGAVPTAAALVEPAAAETAAPPSRRPVRAIGWIEAPKGLTNPIRHLVIDLPDALRPEGVSLRPQRHVLVDVLAILPMGAGAKAQAKPTQHEPPGVEK